MTDPTSQLSPEAQASKEKSRRQEHFIVVIATAIVAFGVLLFIGMMQHYGMLAPKMIKVSTQGRPTIGSAASQPEVVIYGDFQCPHCQAFHFETLPDLERKLTGKARIVFLNRVIFGEPSVQAAVAAECAFRLDGLPGYRKASGQFYAEGRARGEADHTWLTPEHLRLLAAPSDDAKFAACQQDAQVREQVIAESQNIADQGGNTTPGVLVDGKTIRPTRDAILGAVKASKLCLGCEGF